ncbi:MAG: methyltransferase domain-containing protein [Hyphomicrobiaceae bacterium]|nr:methyltransferase domain-containing protein [Hyphomicrobiaceae bacterium]
MSKSLIKSQFGAAADKYATSRVHAKGASLGRLVELVKPKANWHALDVATGGGHTAAAFAPHVAAVIASDLTPEMLQVAAKVAKEKGLTNVTTAEADAEALPFADASFDLVTCRIAPHHFGDIPRFVSEVRRVLKPGGTFALVDNISPDEESTPGYDVAELSAAADYYNAFEKLRDPSHGRALGLSEWTSALEAAGFSVEHKERLPKDMDFQPWAERLGADAPTIDRLRKLLTEAPAAVTAFLRPREEEGELWFTLDEAIVISRKPAA